MRKRATALIFVAAFSFMMISPMFVTAQTIPYEGSLVQGPFVDKIVYKEITGDDQQVLALINDETDMMSDMLDPTYLPQLDAAENVEAFPMVRNGFGHFTINNDKYPLNITALRRAFAYALDKERGVAEIWEGEGEPHDAPLPAPNPWTIEGLMPYTYYAAQPIIANQLLDDAGFIDLNADGWREAPNGEEFQITVEMATAAESQIAFAYGGLAKEAFDSIGINSVAQPTDFNEYIARINNHGDYDIVFFGYVFSSFTASFLETNFASEHYRVTNLNDPNFRNATYDAWLPQLNFGETYEEILEAAYELQKILIYECPMVIAYNNIDFTAYRNDRFEGHIESTSGYNLANAFTNLRIHLKPSEGGPWGGTFRISIGEEVETFNYFVSTSAFAAAVQNNLFNGIITLDNYGDIMPDIATSWIVEENVDNPDVPVGHQRFTFELLQNATWSDGVPITAEDVAFSLNYKRDALATGLSAAALWGDDLAAAYAAGTYTVVVEMSRKSFWWEQYVGFTQVIPKHIWQDIGVDGWSQYNPVYGDDPYPTSGAFVVTEAVEGEFYEITSRRIANGGAYPWAHQIYPAETTTTTTEPTTGPTTTPPDFTLAIVAGAVGAAVVILVGGFVLLRQK
jgi:ABC-type transport system substrate-binding protein